MISKILKTIDCGKACGVYLISLGVLSIFFMFFMSVSLKRLDWDLSPLLLFWAGYYVTKHNHTARKWVIGIALIGVVMVSAMAMIIPFIKAEYVKINLPYCQQQKPSWAVAYFALLVGLIFALIPILLLYNGKARREFGVVSND